MAAVLIVGNALTSPSSQDPWGEIYIVQANDWLSRIAGEFYGNVFAYPAIAEATTIRTVTDDTFTCINDADFIEVGQKLLMTPAPRTSNQYQHNAPALLQDIQSQGDAHAGQAVQQSGQHRACHNVQYKLQDERQ